MHAKRSKRPRLAFRRTTPDHRNVNQFRTGSANPSTCLPDANGPHVYVPGPIAPEIITLSFLPCAGLIRAAFAYSTFRHMNRRIGTLNSLHWNDRLAGALHTGTRLGFAAEPLYKDRNPKPVARSTITTVTDISIVTISSFLACQFHNRLPA